MNINLTLFMQAAAFAAFIWFTAKFIWPPLMGAIASRQKQIADGLAAGEQGRKELANTEKRIADMLAEAKGKAAEIVATGEKFRAETVDAAKGEAKAEADRIIAAAHAAARAGRGPREGAAAQPGRRSGGRGSVEDPAARSRSEGARRAAGVDREAALDDDPHRHRSLPPGGNLLGAAGTACHHRPALRGSGVRARARAERAAGVVADAALHVDGRRGSARERGARQSEAVGRRQGIVAAVDRGRARVRRRAQLPARADRERPDQAPARRSRRRSTR